MKTTGLQTSEPGHLPITFLPESQSGSGSHSFILRIWKETVDRSDGEHAWRGTIDCVGSDQKFYFNDLNGIGRFIEEVAGIDLGNRAPWWRRFGDWLRSRFH